MSGPRMGSCAVGKEEATAEQPCLAGYQLGTQSDSPPGGDLIRPPPPHPTCSQEITLPILSSPAGTGPNYATDPLLSLFLLALHEFLHLLVGP